jgi:hypothetical protein
MDVERFVSTECPPEPELAAWQAWFRHHGIDPVYVPSFNTIERRAAVHQIALHMYDMHDGCDCGRDECRGVYSTGKIVQRVFQLDGPPLPFPVTSPRSA